MSTSIALFHVVSVNDDGTEGYMTSSPLPHHEACMVLNCCKGFGPFPYKLVEAERLDFEGAHDPEAFRTTL